MRANFLLVLASATLALGTPLPRDAPGCSSPRAKPVLPVNGGAKELPAAPSGATLKYIALGFGIQNYTCASTGATPTGAGALAVLYDITNLYPGSRPNSLSQDAWTKLSSKALDTHDVPLNFDPSTDGRIASAAPGASATNPFPANAPLKLDGMAPLAFAGHHFFNEAGVPAFVLDGGRKVLLGKKLDAVDAPASADKGPDGTGAVAWLYLGDNGGSQGLKYVYRVLTSGGNPHGCSSAGKDTTHYTATYWFFS
ncbi:Fc.00g097540.m01.CDS01 [Cosmosporella sp. VM-42]